MAATTRLAVPLGEYLHSSCSPDCDMSTADCVAETGENDHVEVQGALVQ